MFLVCVSFDETIEDIAVALTENNIPHAILHGSVHEYEEIIGRYMRKEVRVLLLNIRALYAGVDLQSTTDIVIVDSMRMENLGQIVGRAQRLGRTCSLTVHSLRYVGHEPTRDEHAACSSSRRDARGKLKKDPKQAKH